MMKIKSAKRITSAFLTLVMVLSFVGCSKNSEEEYSYYSTYDDNTASLTSEASSRSIGTAGGIDGLDKNNEIKKGSGIIKTNEDAGSNAADGTIKKSVTIDSAGVGKSSDIAFPKRNLKDKTIYVFSWRDPNKSEFVAASKVAKDKLGMKIKHISTTHETYWNDLSSMIASGKQVDLIDLEWDFYPRAITTNIVQPLEKYIDFNTPLWADFASVINKYSYKDHIYFGIQNAMLGGLVYYNPKSFKELGLKTPRQYLEEDNWTLQTMTELAKKLTKKDKAGNVSRIGLVPSGDAIAAIAGVDIVEPSRQSNYKLNLKNSRIAKVMNAFYDMGVNGNGSCAIVAPIKVLTNEAAMVMTASWAATNEFEKLHSKGQLEWCIYPKLDKNSTYYYSVAAYPRWGMVKSAKNPEGAAAYIEVNKWTYLGQPWINDLPYPSTAYTKEYKVKSSSKFTDSEVKYTRELLSKNYPLVITNYATSYIGIQGFPGLYEVLNGADWSSVLAKQEPEIKATLNAYYK